jgi:LmbE family N-acetylglucosaminyl deacetylase
MSRVLVFSPHLDDELIGPGGTLLRHADRGDFIHWALMTRQADVDNSTCDVMDTRKEIIENVIRSFGFDSFSQYPFQPATISDRDLPELVRFVKSDIDVVRPDVVYMPWPADIHSDHQICAQAILAASKWFRAPTIRKILSYDTLSETESNAWDRSKIFTSNYFVDISMQIERKIKIVELYGKEFSYPPFPRSKEIIDAKARLVGSACGHMYAEHFSVVSIRDQDVR